MQVLLLQDLPNLLGLSNLLIIKMLITLFIAILFLQSGLDKVFDYGGNLAYFKDHFKNSPLKGTVGLLMPVITLLEVGAGIVSVLGLVFLFLGNSQIAFYGLLLAALSLVALFFGQRIAKDYAGSAVLVPYFLLTVFGLYLFV